MQQHRVQLGPRLKDDVTGEEDRMVEVAFQMLQLPHEMNSGYHQRCLHREVDS
jgi:hypothetical protein